MTPQSPIWPYSYSRSLWRCLRLAVPIAGLFCLATIAFSSQELRNLQFDPARQIAAVAMGQLGIACFASRLHGALVSLAVPATFRRTFRIHYQSLMFYFLLPASLGQDAARGAMILSQEHAKVPGRTLARSAISTSGVVLLDRIVGMFTLTLIALGALPFSALADKIQADRTVVIAGALTIAVVGGLVVAAKAWTARSRSDVIRLLASTQRLPLAVCIGASAAGQLLLAISVLAFLPPTQVTISLADVLVISAVATFGQLVPISVAGIGSGEVAAYGLYLLIGLSPLEAVLPVAAFYLQHLIGAFVGGAAAIARASDPFGRARSIAE